MQQKYSLLNFRGEQQMEDEIAFWILLYAVFVNVSYIFINVDISAGGTFL